MNDKEFKALQAKWYNKLKRSGFDDIELGFEYSDYIKNHGITTAKRYDSNTFEHYRRCRIHLNHHKFKDKYDKRLFIMYTEGISYRKMIVEFKRRYKLTRSVYYFHSNCKRLLIEMNLLRLWINEESEESDVVIAMRNE